MAFQLPNLPSFQTNIPQMPDPVQKFAEIAQLKNMLSANALREQLAPLQIQEQQQKVQQETMATETQKIQLEGQKSLQKWLQEGDTNEDIPADQFKLNDKIATFVGVDSKDPIMQVVRSMAQHGVPAPMLMAEAQGMLQRRNEYNKGTDEQQKIVKDNYDVWKDAMGRIFNADPKDRSLLVAEALPRLQAATHLSPELDSMLNLLRQNPDAAPIAYNLVAAQEKALGLREAAAKAGTAEIAEKEAAAEATGQVTPKMRTEQALKLHLATATKAAEQAIADGDPRAAAQLLISGTVAPSQLISSRKPAFAQQAFTAAAQMQPGWSATKADADYKVATSAGQVAFFGSAKSLTDPGGTLDQLAAAGKDIPGGKIPVFNTVADAIKASTGSGPIAKYAAIALGVADDYAKVMGGGQGSDTSRQQALQIISAKQSPEQRAASIEGIRGAVGSQASSRIGTNAVLQKMYGGNLTPQGGVGGQVKTVSMAQIEKAAKDHGVSVDEAKRSAQAAGYQIK